MTLITYLTRVHFADGVLEEALWSELSAASRKRVLVLADPEHASGENIERLFAGIPVRTSKIIFSDIPHVPTEDSAVAVAEIYARGDCDVIVAFGNASTIDLAKVAKAAIAHGPPLCTFSLARGGSRLIASPGSPDVYAIPSIGGFGSAVSAQSPLILSSGERALLMCKQLIPNVTICDPTLTLTQGVEATASAGADAITHCIEAYLSKSYNPPAEGIAFDGLTRAVRNLRRVINHANDIDARREMMAASLNGALALQKGLGASQAISNALETVCPRRLEPGSINRIALPGVLRFNAGLTDEKYDVLTQVFGAGKGRAGDLAQRVETYFGDLPMPRKLSELGLSDDDLVTASAVAAHDMATGTNPRHIGLEDYLGIMRSVH